MSRSIVFCIVLGAVPLFLACEKGGAEADKSGAAQSEVAKAREDYRHQSRRTSPSSTRPSRFRGEGEDH